MSRSAAFALIVAAIMMPAVAPDASADVLTPAEAIARVGSAAAPKAARKMAARVASGLTSEHVRTISRDGHTPELYVFTPASGGMLIVSAESETPALLGYADSFAADASVPPALDYMMQCYAEEIDAMRRGDVIYGEAPATDFEPVDIICTTRWNQDAPYNSYCPQLEDGTNAYTGCVATAMAQVLATYRYPERCSGGEMSYLWTYANKMLTLDFDEVVLDWNNMADDYRAEETSAEQRDAVATLMRALGRASHMNYTPTASGAYGNTLASGLMQYFDFEADLGYYLREWFPIARWKQMIYDVLAGGHAVYYDGATAGLSTPAGHAFVIDGYLGDGLFHVNWGWGGMSDGYFLLTSLDPAVQGIGGASATSGFVSGQGAILGLKPGRTIPVAEAPLCFYTIDAFSAAVKSAPTGSEVKFVLANSTGLYNASGLVANGVHAAVKFAHADGRTFYAADAAGYDNLATWGGIWPATAKIPANLPEGDYTVTPAVYSTITEKYYDAFTPVGVGSAIAARVKDSVIEFGDAVAAELSLAVNGEIGQITVDSGFSLNCSVTNVGTENFDGFIYAALVKPGSTALRTVIGNFVLCSEPAEVVDVTVPCMLSDKTVPSGEYELVFVARAGGEFLCEPVPVKVRANSDAAELMATKVKCESNASNKLAFNVTLRAVEGDYRGTPSIEIRRGSVAVKTFTAKKRVQVPYGETVQWNIEGEFPEGEIGQRYSAYVMYVRAGELRPTTGEAHAFFTLQPESAISEIGAGTDADAVEYYDLAGRRVDVPSKGLYIVRRGGNTTKIIL